MKRFCYTAAALFLSLFITICSAETITTTKTVAATEKPQAPIGARLWNLQDADILSIINEVSLETGKNFVVDPRVNGKISLVSSKPIKPNEVYDVFLSILGLLGYSAIQSGDVIKIVPNMESGEFATKVATSQRPGKGDEVVVRIIRLENIAANQLIPIIRPMLPQWSNVSAYAPGNVLIVLGRAANLQRIVDVIHHIDESASSNIDIVPLHQASAAQLATVLTNLQNAARATGDVPQVSIAADERSNSLLLSGNKAARLHTKILISQLDTPGSGAKGNTEVVYLRYLQAKTFAPLLGKIAQNMQGKENKDTASASSTTTASTSSTTVTNTKETPENKTNIQAEPGTNALIITAPPAMMLALNNVISKLDIRPAQVLVEGIIVEVNQSDLQSLGIQWGALTDNIPETADSASGGGGQNPATSIIDFPPAGAGNIGIIPHAQLRAVLSMLQNKTGVDILSTPSIAVLDNQKAVLEIGQSVPIQSGSYATTGTTGTVTPFNTIDMKPVTLKLTVTPQINLGNAVRLIINLKNDSLQNPTNPGLTPIINTSSIINSVIINSEDILVLGGLIRNNITESENKVPIVGDIPIIGKLFRQKVSHLEKDNLLVFIKPTILRNSQDVETITHNKYSYARDVQIQYPEKLGSVEEQKSHNILPLWKNDVKLPKPFETKNEMKIPPPFVEYKN